MQDQFGKSDFRTSGRPIRLPSLEFHRLDATGFMLDTTNPQTQKIISSLQVGRLGHDNELQKAINDGHMLGYRGAEEFLKDLDDDCRPGGMWATPA